MDQTYPYSPGQPPQAPQQPPQPDPQQGGITSAPQPIPNAVPPTTAPVMQPAPTPMSQPPQPTHTPTNIYVGLTGSQLQERKQHTPVGMYVIAGLVLLGFAGSFFNSGQTGIFVTVAMLVDLMLAIGLIVRVSVARKLMMSLSVLIIVLCAASAILLAGLQHKLTLSEQQYDAAVNKLQGQAISDSQQTQLDALRATMENAQRQAGNAITPTYVSLGVAAGSNTLALLYLGRPRVKRIFEA